jgi:hypothetical protein
MTPILLMRRTRVYCGGLIKCEAYRLYHLIILLIEFGATFHGKHSDVQWFATGNGHLLGLDVFFECLSPVYA